MTESNEPRSLPRLAGETVSRGLGFLKQLPGRLDGVDRDTSASFNETLVFSIGEWCQERFGIDRDTASNVFHEVLLADDDQFLQGPMRAIQQVQYMLTKSAPTTVVLEISILFQDGDGFLQTSIRREVPWSDIPPKKREAMIVNNGTLTFELYTGDLARG